MESKLSRLAQAAYPTPSFESKGRAEPRVGYTLFRRRSFSPEGCGAQREGKAQKGHKNCTREMKTYPGGAAVAALSATCSGRAPHVGGRGKECTCGGPTLRTTQMTAQLLSWTMD